MDIDDEDLDLFGSGDFIGPSPFWKSPMQSSKPLTRTDFDTAVDLIFRDHGIFGRHPLECIYLTDEDGKTHWLCAPNCPFNRSRSQSDRTEDPESDQ